MCTLPQFWGELLGFGRTEKRGSGEKVRSKNRRGDWQRPNPLVNTQEKSSYYPSQVGIGWGISYASVEIATARREIVM